MIHSSSNEQHPALKPGRRLRGWMAAFVVGCAFTGGWWLGHGPARHVVARPATPDAVATFFAGPEVEGRNEGAGEAGEQIAPGRSVARGRSLRVRATASVSSERARAGEAVIFRTEHAMRTRSGKHVPAGALVEGVIAGAAPSSAKTAGQLVIEIRALHVGNQTIPLHALPYMPGTLGGQASSPAGEEAHAEDVRALGIRNQLRPYPEAVMPKETVIEFQLVDEGSGKNIHDDLLAPGHTEPAFPKTLRKPGNSVPASDPALPDLAPISPGHGARIATDRG